MCSDQFKEILSILATYLNSMSIIKKLNYPLKWYELIIFSNLLTRGADHEIYKSRRSWQVIAKCVEVQLATEFIVSFLNGPGCSLTPSRVITPTTASSL